MQTLETPLNPCQQSNEITENALVIADSEHNLSQTEFADLTCKVCYAIANLTRKNKPNALMSIELMANGLSTIADDMRRGLNPSAAVHELAHARAKVGELCPHSGEGFNFGYAKDGVNTNPQIV